jgi:hypothetical protein
MAHLLGAEWLKLRKSLGFKVLGLVSVALTLAVFAMISVLVAEIEQEVGAVFSGAVGFYQALGQTQLNSILISILAAIFICKEFDNRTFGLSLFSGFTRRKLMAAKVGMLFIGTIIISTIMPVLMTICFSLANGFGGTAEDLALPMLRDFGLYLLGNITIAAFCAFLAYVIRNVGGTIGAGVGICMVLAIVSQVQTESVKQILDFSFISQLQYIGTPELSIPFYCGVMLVTLVVLLACASVVFEKSDLK